MVKEIHCTQAQFNKKFMQMYAVVLRTYERSETERRKLAQSTNINTERDIIFSKNPNVLKYVWGLAEYRQDILATSNEDLAMALTWDYFVNKERKAKKTPAPFGL